MNGPLICPCGNGSCGKINSVECLDVDCIQRVFDASCPRAFSPNNTGNCAFVSGFNSIVMYVLSLEAFIKCTLFFRGADEAILSLVDCDRASAPNVAVVVAVGELIHAFHSTQTAPAHLSTFLTTKHNVESTQVSSSHTNELAGMCDVERWSAICNFSAAINATFAQFQNAYPMRYVVGTGARELLLREAHSCYL